MRAHAGRPALDSGGRAFRHHEFGLCGLLSGGSHRGSVYREACWSIFILQVREGIRIPDNCHRGLCMSQRGARGRDHAVFHAVSIHRHDSGCWLFLLNAAARTASAERCQRQGSE